MSPLPRVSRAALGAVLLLALLPSAHARAAQGVNLAWNQCFGDAGAVQNGVFACDTNAGSHVLYGSFVLGAAFPIVIGLEMVVDVESASPTLPAWWEFRNDGTCRTTSLGFEYFPDPLATTCDDWSVGQSAGGLAGYCTLANAMPIGCGLPGQPANRARIKTITAVALQNAQDLIANKPYFAFGLRINHAKTVGAGACGGCATPVCLVFNSVNVVGRFNWDQRMLTNAANPASNVVVWQGGGAGGVPGCLLATTAKKSTWGAVKSLYR